MLTLRTLKTGVAVILVRGNRIIFVTASIASGIAVSLLLDGGQAYRSLLLLAGTATLMVLGDRLREVEVRVDAAAPGDAEIDRRALCAEYFEEYKPRFAVTAAAIAFLCILAWSVIVATAESSDGPPAAVSQEDPTASARVAGERATVRIACPSQCAFRVRAAMWTSSGRKVRLQPVTGTLGGGGAVVIEMRPDRESQDVQAIRMAGEVDIGARRILISWP